MLYTSKYNPRLRAFFSRIVIALSPSHIPLGALRRRLVMKRVRLGTATVTFVSYTLFKLWDESCNSICSFREESGLRLRKDRINRPSVAVHVSTDAVAT